MAMPGVTYPAFQRNWLCPSHFVDYDIGAANDGAGLRRALEEGAKSDPINSPSYTKGALFYFRLGIILKDRRGSACESDCVIDVLAGVFE
jgi:hypothetical protein